MTFEEHISFYAAVEEHVRIEANKNGMYKNHVEENKKVTKGMQELITKGVRELYGIDLANSINEEAILITWNYNDDKLECLNFYTYVLCHGIVVPYYNWIDKDKFEGRTIALYGKRPGHYVRMQKK